MPLDSGLPATSRPATGSNNGSTKPGPFHIVFDGGSLGNPGEGYGSYQVLQDDVVIRHQREAFGNRVTNNQAEYLTLIRALQWLIDVAGDDAARTRVLVNGDSQLVLNQLLGRWKVRNAGLRSLHEQASRLVEAFGCVDLVWQPRAKSVERLGH